MKIFWVFAVVNEDGTRGEYKEFHMKEEPYSHVVTGSPSLSGIVNSIKSIVNESGEEEIKIVFKPPYDASIDVTITSTNIIGTLDARYGPLNEKEIEEFFAAFKAGFERIRFLP